MCIGGIYDPCGGCHVPRKVVAIVTALMVQQFKELGDETLLFEEGGLVITECGDEFESVQFKF